MSLDSLIYLIDDDADDSAWMIDGLFDAGFTRVEHFVNGAQAVKALKRNGDLPELIFLDNHMPQVDGFGVMSEIQKHVDSGEIKLCLMSAARPEWFKHAGDTVRVIYKEDPFSTRDEIKQTAEDLLLGVGF